MLAIQGLKKQLRGIRSTRKLTKAMRTVSTVKFSKLNAIYSEYSKYGKYCRKTCKQYGQFFLENIPATNSNAPDLVIVMTSNKGLCGKFNAEILEFAEEELMKKDSYLLVACGKKAIHYFKTRKRDIEKVCVWGDIPTYEESSALLEEIIAWRREGKVSRVYVIYSEYVNMMNQIPRISELFSLESDDKGEMVLFLPDKSTVNRNTATMIFRAMFYEYLLETAFGAQAATLMTMRAAYDTATEYFEELEKRINRMRQSAVTADVIETSAEQEE